MVMHFKAKLQLFLRKNRCIYTVRRFLYENLGTVFVPGVGDCKRYLVKEDVSPEDLVQYLEWSGFSSVEEWWSKIEQLNYEHKDCKYHLYKLIKLDWE